MKRNKSVFIKKQKNKEFSRKSYKMFWYRCIFAFSARYNFDDIIIKIQLTCSELYWMNKHKKIQWIKWLTFTRYNEFSLCEYTKKMNNKFNGNRFSDLYWDAFIYIVGSLVYF